METYRHVLDVIGSRLYDINNSPFDGSNVNVTIALFIFCSALITLIFFRMLKTRPSTFVFLFSCIVAMFILTTTLGVVTRYATKFVQCEMRELIIDGQAVDLRYCRHRKTLNSNYGDWKIVVPNK